MATIRVTGTTLQIGDQFFPEGVHQIKDKDLPSLSGLPGIEVLPEAQKPTPTVKE